MKKKETKVADFAVKTRRPQRRGQLSAEICRTFDSFFTSSFLAPHPGVRDATEITHQLNQANRTRMPEFIKCPSNFE